MQRLSFLMSWNSDVVEPGACGNTSFCSLVNCEDCLLIIIHALEWDALPLTCCTRSLHEKNQAVRLFLHDNLCRLMNTPEPLLRSTGKVVWPGRELGPKHCSAIGSLVASLGSTITELRLQVNVIGNAGAVALACAMHSGANLASLEEIHLHRNMIGDSGALALVVACARATPPLRGSRIQRAARCSSQCPAGPP